MADTSSKTLRLIFTTEDPTRDFILSLDHPKDALNVATVHRSWPASSAATCSWHPAVPW